MCCFNSNLTYQTLPPVGYSLPIAIGTQGEMNLPFW